MNPKNIDNNYGSTFKLHLDRLEAIANEVKVPRRASLKLHLDELEAIDEVKIPRRASLKLN
ncbi:MAG: hypothetical protein AB4290_19160 [Spirulina sp.]